MCSTNLLTYLLFTCLSGTFRFSLMCLNAGVHCSINLLVKFWLLYVVVIVVTVLFIVMGFVSVVEIK